MCNVQHTGCIFWIHLMQRVTLHHPQAERDGTWNGDGYHDDYDDEYYDDVGNIKSKKTMLGSDGFAWSSFEDNRGGNVVKTY